MTGIITLPLVPLRVIDSEQSEMFSQLLFGEFVEILEMNDKWLYVRNFMDDCTGWVDAKMIQRLSSEEEKRLLDSPFTCLESSLIQCVKPISNQIMYLPGGCYFPSYNYGRCIIGDEIFQINEIFPAFSDVPLSNRIKNFAMQFLNAPYLWGGKSIMGMDSSGLVQVVYAMAGIQLSRFVSQQVEFGVVIDFLSEAQSGDLVFFENKDHTIVHVGILLNSSQIIHVSGSVRIDMLDSEGIISAKTGEYTHTLRVVKRVIQS